MKKKTTTANDRLNLEKMLNRANLLKQTTLYRNDKALKELVDEALKLENQEEPMWDLEFKALCEDIDQEFENLIENEDK